MLTPAVTIKLIYSKLSPSFKYVTGSLKVKGERYFNFFKSSSFTKEEIRVSKYSGSGITRAIADFALLFKKHAKLIPSRTTTINKSKYIAM